MNTLMIDEIRQQPQKWRDFVSSEANQLIEYSKFIAKSNFDLFTFLSRGTSEHASMIGQQLVQNEFSKPTTVTNFSTHTMFGKTLQYKNTLGIAISQSGESQDLLSNVRSLIRFGVPVLGITNNESSTLAKLVEKHIYLAAGPEISVAATKTYTLEILAQWILFTGYRRDFNSIVEGVEILATKAEQIIDTHMSSQSELTSQILASDKIVTVGRGWGVATAKEAALKIIETTGKPASGWSVNDAIHGPLGQIDENTLVIVVEPENNFIELIEPFLSKIKSLRAAHISLDSNNRSGASGALGEMLNILPAQIACNFAAVALGRDPDNPSGLSKVTITN